MCTQEAVSGFYCGVDRIKPTQIDFRALNIHLGSDKTIVQDQIVFWFITHTGIKGINLNPTELFACLGLVERHPPSPCIFAVSGLITMKFCTGLDHQSVCSNMKKDQHKSYKSVQVSYKEISYKQEALSSILLAGQWAYTEYSSFLGPPKGE